MTYLWTSEAVSSGHPDKVADQIADAVLDLHLEHDPASRVACEVTLTGDLVLVTGEIASTFSDDSAYQDKIDKVVRDTICEIGYDRDEHSLDGRKVDILYKLKKQSSEIAGAVVKSDGDIGAGDQGIMFGYATREYGQCQSRRLMPLTHALSFELIDSIEHLRREDTPVCPFYPDAKTQVTALYTDEGNPISVDTVLISVCHRPDYSLEEVRAYVDRWVRRALLDRYKSDFGNHPFLTDETKWLVNPAGSWSVGGPASDTGLSGRKIVVDNYGADCPVGGGSFSGKDSSKVDRSGAYAARFIAKNIVAQDLAEKCQVQLSYAIGVAEPVSVRIQSFGTSSLSDKSLENLVRGWISLKPKAIIDNLGLRNPIFRKTAAGGHFGRCNENEQVGFPWEELKQF